MAILNLAVSLEVLEDGSEIKHKYKAGITKETGSDSFLKRDDCATPYWNRLSQFVVVASLERY